MSFQRLAALIQRETEEEFQSMQDMWGSQVPPDVALLDVLEDHLALITAHFGYLPPVMGVSSDEPGAVPLPTHSLWAYLDVSSDPGITVWFGELPFELAIRFSAQGHISFSYIPPADDEWEQEENSMQVNASLEQMFEVLEKTERYRAHYGHP